MNLASLIDLAPIAAGGWFSPVPMLVQLLLLSTPGGMRRTLTFCVGLFTTYAIVGAGAILIGGELQATGDGGRSWYGSAGLLTLGVFFLLGLVKNLVRPPEGPIEPPKILEKLDGLGALGTGLIGGAVVFASLKNLALVLSAISVILDTPGPFTESASIFVLFLMLFVSGISWPFILFVVFAGRAGPLLVRARAWLESNQLLVGNVVFLIFGVAFTAQGARGLFAG